MQYTVNYTTKDGKIHELENIRVNIENEEYSWENWEDLAGGICNGLHKRLLELYLKRKEYRIGKDRTCIKRRIFKDPSFSSNYSKNSTNMNTRKKKHY